MGWNKKVLEDMKKLISKTKVGWISEFRVYFCN
jgi:hypothetical protein